MLTHEEISSLDEILQRHNYDSSSVIAVMQDIQKKYRYLPQEALTYIAHQLHLSEAKVYGVATFYENFTIIFPFKQEKKCLLNFVNTYFLFISS